MKSALILVLTNAVISTGVSLQALANVDSSNHAVSKECEYGHPPVLDYVKGPLNGQLRRTFTNQSSDGAHPGRYKSIQICQRPDGSEYVMITDGYMGVRDVPREILRHEEVNDWDHYDINGANFSRGEKPDTRLKFVAYGPTMHLNGNPDRLWVFDSSPNIIGDMPIIQAVLVDPTANR